MAVKPDGDTEEVPPNARGILDALSRVGYSIDVALADLVDNSIDAGASYILIRLWRRAGHVVAVSVVDDGSGMSDDGMSEAMRFGSQGERDDERLGKFGLGLKAASFSQCKSLTVASRQGSSVAGRRWTEEGITSGWNLEVLARDEARASLARFDKQLDGKSASTVIDWDRIYRFAGAGLDPDGDLQRVIKALHSHLGLVFHRFLAPHGRGGNPVRMVIDSRDLVTGAAGVPVPVGALDPFRYPSSGAPEYPRSIKCDLGAAGEIALDAHVWPPKVRPPEYSLSRGSAAHQGLYFYRNNRLLQAGGWNALRGDAEPHLSLARVRIDLPPGLDEIFSVNVQKSSVQVPPLFLETLARHDPSAADLKDFIRAALDVYKSASAAGKGARPVCLVPGPGVGALLAGKLRVTLLGPGSKGEADGVEFVWGELDPEIFFAVDVGDKRRITLNSLYRAAVLHGARGSAADAPLVKVLLFLLLRVDMAKQRTSPMRRQAHEAMQRLLVQAARAEES